MSPPVDTVEGWNLSSLRGVSHVFYITYEVGSGRTGSLGDKVGEDT